MVRESENFFVVVELWSLFLFRKKKRKFIRIQEVSHNALSWTLFSLHPNMSPGLASVGKNMDGVAHLGPIVDSLRNTYRVKGGLDDK